jgi:uncharacterized phage-like protein YoqJ
MIIAFTGHRPDKLGGYVLPNPTYIKVCQEIDKALKKLKPQQIISGMALGIDQWAANIAIKNNIPFIAAVPFLGQEGKWNLDLRKTYCILLRKAAEQVIVCPGAYSVEKMQIRNEWMVDRCDLLIAVWDGTKGGTGNCVDYAKKINKEILRIDPNAL